MGMEVKCCRDGWGRKPCLMGTDGDGYNLYRDGWGRKSDAVETDGDENQV